MRRRGAPGLAALIASSAIALGGCGSVVGSGNQPSFEFEARQLSPDESVTRMLRVASGSVTVEGPFEVPCSGTAPLGELRRQGRELRTRISWRSEDACSTEPTTYAYTVRISRLEPGEHLVVVEHVTQGNGQVVLTETVVVP